MGKKIIFEKQGYLGIVKLNNPPLNIVDQQFFKELENIQDVIYKEKELRAIVILGEGKAFSAGIDLNYLSDTAANSKFMKDNLEWLQSLYSFWERLPIPVIAGVHGHCIGSGVELIAGVDLRVSSQNAVYCLPEVSLGLSPDMGGTTRITKLIGVSQAKKMIMACEQFGGKEAYRIGLVDYLVDDDELIEFTIALGQRLSSYPPSSVRFSKKGIQVASENSTATGLLFEQAQSIYCCGTEDIQEAIQAFKEKRKGNFTGA